MLAILRFLFKLYYYSVNIKEHMNNGTWSEAHQESTDVTGPPQNSFAPAPAGRVSGDAPSWLVCVLCMHPPAPVTNLSPRQVLSRLTLIFLAARLKLQIETTIDRQRQKYRQHKAILCLLMENQELPFIVYLRLLGYQVRRMLLASSKGSSVDGISVTLGLQGSVCMRQLRPHSSRLDGLLSDLTFMIYKIHIICFNF